MRQMIQEKGKEIIAVKAQIAELEEQIAVQLKCELAALPARFGFANVTAFIAAVQVACSECQAWPLRTTLPRCKNSKRATITDYTRTQARHYLEEGRKGREIAQLLGLSLASVQNIKKALGMVKERKRPTDDPRLSR